jgi:hypothetical protein
MLVAPAARADDEVDQSSLRAEKLATDAEALVARGAYSEAVELYLQASQAAPAAVLAFDIAWIYDQHLRAPKLALDYYKKCLASPDVEPNIAHIATTRVAAIESSMSSSSARAGAEQPPAAPSMIPPTSSAWSPMKTWALAAGGVGVVAIGIGATFGVIAKAKDDDANQYCTGDVCSDSRALTLTDEATSAARVADVAFITGAIFLAGGVALWLLAPKPPSVVSRVLRGTW